MKKGFKILSLLLALLMVVPLIIACGKDDEAADNKDEVSTSGLNFDEGAVYLDNLPALDYDGAVITIATRDRDNYKRDFAAELNGDVLGDAVYKRNMAVQERLNVEFQYAVLSTAESAGAPDLVIRNETMSGNDTFDIAQVRCYDAVEMVLENIYMNVAELEYLEFDQPWWFGQLMNDLSIGDQRRYLMLGDLSIGTFYGASCYYFNKDLYSSNIGDPSELYQLVVDGKWTLEQLKTYSSVVYSDNGSSDPLDGTYGTVFASWGTEGNLIACSGESLTKFDNNGLPYINGGQKFLTMLQSIYDMYYRTEGVYTYKGYEEFHETAYTKFKGGEVMFLPASLGTVQERGIGEVDFYGIIPYPKLDEGIPQYRAMLNPSHAMFAIPVTVDTPDMSAAVLEAMASESYNSVTPLIVDTLLKTRYANDETTVKCIDIILRNAGSDLAMANYVTVGDMMSQIYGCYYHKRETFASSMDGYRPAATKGLQKLIDFYHGVSTES